MRKLNFIIIFFIYIGKVFADDILIQDTRARPSLGKSSAIYFDIINKTAEDVAIIGASAPIIAGKASLRNSYVDTEGVARTTNINKILIPKGTKISFKPQSLHIVISDLKEELKIKDEFSLTIQFEDGSKKTFTVIVKNLN